MLAGDRRLGPWSDRRWSPVRGPAALVLPALMILLGVAILARTLAAGGGALAIGVLMGVLFVAAGTARIYLERRR